MDATTLRMISRYREEAPAPLFLAGYFQSPPQNFHKSGKVVVDIRRDGRDVAMVVRDITLGANQNHSTKYTTKEFEPPTFDEEGVVHAYSTLQRRDGENPFTNAEFLDRAMDDSFRVFRGLDAKIRRSVELMASQVLQSASLTLPGNDGTIYELDFQGKATHFPTVDVAWGESGATPMRDVANLADEIRKDGKTQPAILIFGEESFDRFISDEVVKSRLDNRAMTIGQVAPEPRGRGATFQGWIMVGHYRFEMWTYSESYEDPVTRKDTLYVPANKVMMLSRDGRLDLTHGGYPLFRSVNNIASLFVPQRISVPETGLDLTPNAYITQDGKRLVVGAAARPLTVPTAIDSFGCLTVYTEGGDS